MSLDVTLKVDDKVVFDGNITHNLVTMALKIDLYDPLWEPKERGWHNAYQLIVPICDGLKRLKKSEHELNPFNPPNGWGSYKTLLQFTEDYLSACLRCPHATVETSR